MALFSQDNLNPGVRKREVLGWAMYDFAAYLVTGACVVATAALAFASDTPLSSN